MRIYVEDREEKHGEVGADGGFRGWRVRLSSQRDVGKGLYALSLVLRGSHGFQAGIFSADRQRGRNGWTQAKEGKRGGFSLPPPVYLLMHRLTFQCVFKRYDSFIQAILISRYFQRARERERERSTEDQLSSLRSRAAAITGSWFPSDRSCISSIQSFRLRTYLWHTDPLT